jgi:N-acetylglucosaminyldiphosphoundecaprenol N-acetyl-beta-D-mannosaminyltransferase
MSILSSKSELQNLSADNRLLISCLNAHSYNLAQNDAQFAGSLQKSDVLLADGGGILLACKILKIQLKERVTGYDLFLDGMQKLNDNCGSAFFLGSTEKVLQKIEKRAQKDFPNVKVKTYSPPFKANFSEQDNTKIIEEINSFNPDILWVGLGSPKQEKWASENFEKLNVKGWVASVGAVFDFYSGKIKRAPVFLQKYYLEWLYRFLQEPRRLWRRYLVGNAIFVWNVRREGI